MNRQDLETALLRDEIGLSIGRYHGAHLKTAVEPVYSVTGDRLLPTLLSLHRQSENAAPAPYTPEAAFFDTVSRVLHIRNSDFIDADLPILIELDLRNFIRGNEIDPQFELMAVERDNLERRRVLFCVVVGANDAGSQTLAKVAAAAHIYGIKIGLDDFAIGFPSLDTIDILKPDLLRVDGDWFRRVAAVPPAAKFLRPLFSALRENNASILVDRIGSVTDFMAAQRTGADLVKGALLAPSSPAGSELHLAPLSKADLLRNVSDEKIVQLSSHRSRRR